MAPGEREGRGGLGPTPLPFTGTKGERHPGAAGEREGWEGPGSGILAA